jgi:hypothetical protein
MSMRLYSGLLVIGLWTAGFKFTGGGLAVASLYALGKVSRPPMSRLLAIAVCSMNGRMAADHGGPGCGELADVPEKHPSVLIGTGETFPAGKTLKASW